MLLAAAAAAADDFKASRCTDAQQLVPCERTYGVLVARCAGATHFWHLWERFYCYTAQLLMQVTDGTDSRCDRSSLRSPNSNRNGKTVVLQPCVNDDLQMT